LKATPLALLHSSVLSFFWGAAQKHTHTHTHRHTQMSRVSGARLLASAARSLVLSQEASGTLARRRLSDGSRVSCFF
jgi:hypothetical protein